MMARACDRCSRLKTQCNGDIPCNRCQRLDLECTQTRPVLAKGRPKRDAHNPRPRRSPHDSLPHSPQDSLPHIHRILTTVSSYSSPNDESLQLVRCLPELPISEPIAASLLDLIFTSTSTLGILEIFHKQRNNQSPSNIVPDPPAPKRLRSSSWPSIDSKALLYTLIVVSATVCSPPNPSVNVISLQQHAITSIPALYGNSRDLRIEDALSLCYLSYIGALNAATIKVAERWAVLAVVVSRQAREQEDESTSDQISFHTRASWLICINDRIFSLLHYRQPFGNCLKDTPCPVAIRGPAKLPISIADKMSIGGVLEQPLESSRSFLGRDYFSLFVPLLSPLDFALSEPPPESIPWANATTELERYFSEFPPSILAYDEVTQLHEAEAMFWFQGIYLLLYGKRDLYSCFGDESWMFSPTFLKAVEHAILIGEIIPTMTRLMKSSSQLSPATVYFLLLSSVIHTVLLRQCMFNHDAAPRFFPESDSDKANWARMMDSTHSHLFILRRIKEDSTTCTIDLVHTIETILHSIYTAATTGVSEWDTDFSVLRLYRWTNRGRGIVKIASKVADDLSNLNMGSGSSHGSASTKDNETLRRNILSLFDPKTRHGKLGYFSFSLKES